MKNIKRFVSLILGVVVALLAFALVACSDSKPMDRGYWTVYSPDATIQTNVVWNGDGKLTYTVAKQGQTVVETSALGFSIAEDDLRIKTLEKVDEKKNVKGSYDNITGKHRKVTYEYNQTTFTFKAWKFYLDVILRVYDDGYAFRYNIREINSGSGTMTVVSEDSEFALPKDSSMWTQEYRSSEPDRGNFFSYENAYTRSYTTDLGGKILAMPILYKIGDGDLYSLITESALIGSGFYGSFLAESEQNYGTGILQTVRTPAGCSENTNRIEYPFTSPWRLGVVGDMNTLVGSEMLEKVYDDVEYWKPDDYEQLSDEEKAIYNYDWVEPGATAFSWLRSQNDRVQDNFEFQKEYVDLARDMGWKYTILDGGWDDDLDNRYDEFADFMDYADKQGVKVIVWCDAFNTFAKGNKDFLTTSLDLWKSFGVAGIKIDFFSGETVTKPVHQGEDIETIKWYETVYQECAKRKMIVNIHGSNKPTGERRQYPNVINREGIYGNEFATVISNITVNHMFTRAMLGVSDFTPVVIPRNNALTMAHQMALAVLFEAGVPSMGDSAQVYYDETITEFYKSVPVVRDEIIFLGGRPDRYYVAAIKVNDDWFVAGINTNIVTDTINETTNVELDFSFLGAGKYSADLYLDVKGNNAKVTKTTRELTSSDKLTVAMEKNGGFVYHIKKQA